MPDACRMDDQRVGIAVRATRVKQRKRQVDVAKAAGLSRATIGRIETGHLDTVTLRSLRRVCATLELRIELLVRSRGGDLDRMLAARHAKLAESVIRRLRADSPDWQLVPEVSFSFWGERGVVDILAWHPGRRALLIIEIKTEMVDVGETLGTLDKKRRLGGDIAAARGLDPETVSVWLVIASGRTNERRIADHRETLRAALPDDGRRVRGWLTDPVEVVAAMSFWRAESTAPSNLAQTQRVRPYVKVRPSANVPRSAKRTPVGR